MIKESIPFTITIKRIKYLGINLPKETKELYKENYKTSERNQRWHKQMERYSMFLGRKNQYYENEYTTKCNYGFNAIPVKLSMAFHNSHGNTKDPKQPKQSWQRRMELGQLTFLTSGYTTKLQASEEYGAGTKTEI